MGKDKIRHLVEKKKRDLIFYYWQPSKTALAYGYVNQSLGKDYEKAKERALKINEKYDAERKKGKPVKGIRPGSIEWLSREYYKDQAFTDLALSHQKDNRRRIIKIEAEFAGIPAKHITRLMARTYYQRISEKRREAQATIAAARVLFNFGRNIGMLSENPFSELRVKGNPPRDKVWSHEQENTLILKSKELNRNSIALSVLIASNTSQREGDVLRATWSQYNGEKIRLKQNKTGVILDVVCTTSLKTALDTEIERLEIAGKPPEAKDYIVISEQTGRAYDRHNFNGWFRYIADEAKIDRTLQYRDLRRTAIVRLTEAGCTVQEVSAVSGHDIAYCQKIIDTYCPRNHIMAANAIAKLEAYQGENVGTLGKRPNRNVGTSEA